MNLEQCQCGHDASKHVATVSRVENHACSHCSCRAYRTKDDRRMTIARRVLGWLKGRYIADEESMIVTWPDSCADLSDIATEVVPVVSNGDLGVTVGSARLYEWDGRVNAALRFKDGYQSGDAIPTPVIVSAPGMRRVIAVSMDSRR